MSPTAYYNEFDPRAAQWLRELIKAEIIAPGFVDERSITEVNPYELTQYTQHHFFAGIGGWSYALRLAGWPDDKPVITGSCPCQPFSAAGKGLGTKDERHLWPVFYNIITFLGAPIVFGEQVASKAAEAWLDSVFADLEGAGYACGASDLCAASVGADHIRQRFFWGADAVRSRPLPAPHAGVHSREEGRGAWYGKPLRHGNARRLADANGRDTSAERQQSSGEQRQQPQDGGAGGGLGNTNDSGSQGQRECGHSGNEWITRAPSMACGLEHTQGDGRLERWTESERRRTGRGCWDVYETILCADGKTRRFEPGSFPLAHGVPGRMGLLRGYGNAIVPQAAAEFIKAYCGD